jgi:hypothetical protein
MGTVLDLVKGEVEKTIRRLNVKKFVPDPIAGEHFSKIPSILSSANKRHGYILERAILEALRQCPHFEVWHEKQFHLPPTVLHMVDGSIAEPTKLIGAVYPYSAEGPPLQVDVLVFNKNTGTLEAYEVKRGWGPHDSRTRRRILRDVLCVQILLKSYGEQRGLEVKNISSHVIFYYGKCSIPKPFAITGAELDEHFGWPVKEAVEEVNSYFQQRLFSILSGAG